MAENGAPLDEGPVHLLLVEDNPGDARLLRELLRIAGLACEVSEVGRLRDALELLGREEPDAILLDLSLPDAQGLDTVFQALNAAPEIPVIVLTGLKDEQTALQAMRAGAQDYLLKGELDSRLLVRSIRYAIERGRQERERESLLHREQEARSRAEAATRSRDVVLGIVAHDLRNPLGAITTTASSLLDGGLSEDQRRHHLEVVLRSAEQMDRLIQDLLDVARVEAGSLRVETRPVPAGDLLDEALALMQPAATGAGLRLRVEKEPGIPPVQADRQRIEQVLGNLIANAMRFTPRRGTIALEARTFGSAVLLSVTDSGVGIPAEELPHLFDRLWQAEHARRGGSGLGLAISKGIVEAHGGRIWAASELGQGTTIFFTLPLAGAEAGVAESGAAPPIHEVAAAGPEARPTAPVRILLADDHATVRHGLAAILARAEGFEVVAEAGSGEEAVTRALQLRPDVVLMDLAMPGMGGIEATRQITAALPQVHVLALTAESEEHALLPVLQAGGSGFVRKTTAHEDLLPALATVARDEVFLYASGSRLLLEDFLRGRAEEEGPLASLSEQERQIVRLIAEGFNSAEIGKKLFLSPKTIDSYRSRLMRGLGLSRRSEVVRLALRAGLLRPERTVPRTNPGTG